MEIYIYYIYIFCRSHKVQKPNWSGERTLAKVFRLLLILPCGSGLFLWLLGLGWKKKKKKNAFKKDKVKRRALFFPLWFPFPPGLPPPPPPSLTACC